MAVLDDEGGALFVKYRSAVRHGGGFVAVAEWCVRYEFKSLNIILEQERRAMTSLKFTDLHVLIPPLDM